MTATIADNIITTAEGPRPKTPLQINLPELPLPAMHLLQSMVAVISAVPVHASLEVQLDCVKVFPDNVYLELVPEFAMHVSNCIVAQVLLPLHDVPEYSQDFTDPARASGCPAAISMAL